MISWPNIIQARHFVLIAIAVIALDVASKTYMLALIFNPPRVLVLLPFLNFAPAYNGGVSFGLLTSGGEITRYGISGLAVIVVLWLFFQLSTLSKWQRLGAALISGGALGNVIDRIIYGKVVDFVDFHLGTWHYPAFNVADAAIFIGVALWLLSAIGEMRQNSAANQKAQNSKKDDS